MSESTNPSMAPTIPKNATAPTDLTASQQRNPEDYYWDPLFLCYFKKPMKPEHSDLLWEKDNALTRCAVYGFIFFAGFIVWGYFAHRFLIANKFTSEEHHERVIAFSAITGVVWTLSYCGYLAVYWRNTLGGKVVNLEEAERMIQEYHAQLPNVIIGGEVTEKNLLSDRETTYSGFETFRCTSVQQCFEHNDGLLRKVIVIKGKVRVWCPKKPELIPSDQLESLVAFRKRALIAAFQSMYGDRGFDPSATYKQDKERILLIVLRSGDSEPWFLGWFSWLLLPAIGLAFVRCIIVAAYLEDSHLLLRSRKILYAAEEP